MEMKKLLDESNMPEGALTRHIRDVYAVTCMRGDESQTFEEFQKSWIEDYDKRIDYLNKNNPIECDKKINIVDKTYISFFKRKGLDWHCTKFDYNPYGGGGSISFKEALESIDDSKITEQILKIELGE